MSDQINVNAIANTLQTKVDLPTGSSQSDVDFVIEKQEPNSSNNYTWYRKYKSGWVEQGGRTTTEYGSSGTTQALPIEMSDTDYQIMVTQITPRRDGMSSTVIPGGYAYSTTAVFVAGRYVAASETAYLSWEVKGLSA